MNSRSVRSPRGVWFWSAAAIVFAALLSGNLRIWSTAGQAAEEDAGDAAVAAPNGVGPDFDAAKVEGHHLCVDCHRAEVTHWLDSSHARRPFELLRGQNAKDYAEKLNIPVGTIGTTAVCAKCHATPRIDPSGSHRTIAGVSCEACHNPAGGEDGWLNAHAVYGPKGTRRGDELKEHYDDRADRCRSAGQLRSSDLVDWSKRCLQCHIVGDAELIKKTGHKIGKSFDLLESISEDGIRHNFQIDQQTNAEVASLWLDSRWDAGRSVEARKRIVRVVGRLVELEICLRLLAGSKFEDDRKVNYATALADRARQVNGALQKTGVEGVEELTSAVGEHLDTFVDDALLDELDFSDQDVTKLMRAADQALVLAKQYANGDGRGLEGVAIE